VNRAPGRGRRNELIVSPGDHQRRYLNLPEQRCGIGAVPHRPQRAHDPFHRAPGDHGPQMLGDVGHGREVGRRQQLRQEHLGQDRRALALDQRDHVAPALLAGLVVGLRAGGGEDQRADPGRVATQQLERHITAHGQPTHHCLGDMEGVHQGREVIRVLGHRVALGYLAEPQATQVRRDPAPSGEGRHQLPPHGAVERKPVDEQDRMPVAPDVERQGQPPNGEVPRFAVADGRPPAEEVHRWDGAHGRLTLRRGKLTSCAATTHSLGTFPPARCRAGRRLYRAAGTQRIS